MTAISSANHFKFLDGLKQKVQGLNKQQQDGLKVNVEALLRIYQQYQLQLPVLRKLIGDYETVQCRIRVELRKQQITQKQK